MQNEVIKIVRTREQVPNLLLPLWLLMPFYMLSLLGLIAFMLCCVSFIGLIVG